MRTRTIGILADLRGDSTTAQGLRELSKIAKNLRTEEDFARNPKGRRPLVGVHVTNVRLALPPHFAEVPDSPAPSLPEPCSPEQEEAFFGGHGGFSGAY